MTGLWIAGFAATGAPARSPKKLPVPEHPAAHAVYLCRWGGCACPAGVLRMVCRRDCTFGVASVYNTVNSGSLILDKNNPALREYSKCMHDAACLVARMHKASAAQADGRWQLSRPDRKAEELLPPSVGRSSFGVVCGPCLHIYTLQTLPLHDTPAQAAHPGYRACMIARLVARQARVRILAAVKGQEHHEQRLLSASAHVVAYMLVGVWCQDML